MDGMDWLEGLALGRRVEKDLRPGGVLFRQGDPVVALYRILSGHVRLVRFLEDGAAVTLHVAGPGETFAEASLFAPHYHCDAVAEGPARVAVYPKPDILAGLEERPEIALTSARGLAVQVRDLRTRLELRGIRSAAERVLAWLRLQARGNPPGLSLDRAWRTVAGEIGLTHEAVYRALAQLEGEGRIERRGNRVVLTATGP